MKNFIQKGEAINVTVSADTASGDLVIVGDLIGVAACTVKSGGKVAVHREGVYELPKASGALTQGAKAYWDATAKNVTATSASNTLIGFAAEAAASGDTTVRVLLNS